MEGRSRESFFSEGRTLLAEGIGKSSVKVCTMAPVPISPHRSFTLSMTSAKGWYFAKKKAKLADFLMISETEN